MNKEFEALQKLRDLVENLTRIDYVPTDLRNEVKELLIYSYEASNGYFSQIEKALKRNEPMIPRTKTYTNGFFKLRACSVCDTTIEKEFVYCPCCGQKLDWSDE